MMMDELAKFLRVTCFVNVDASLVIMFEAAKKHYKYARRIASTVKKVDGSQIPSSFSRRPPD